MDKKVLIDQLGRQLEASARAALSARDAAAKEARDGATPDEKREDARAAHQLTAIGGASQARAKQALAEADMLAAFRPMAFDEKARILMGGIVEIEENDNGEGRTFFLDTARGGLTRSG